MSRNLCKTNCDRCGGDVSLTGTTAPITKEQAGAYFDEYEGMLVADATCEICEARYMAWVNETTRKDRKHANFFRHPTSDRGFVDLSYRASFNDEPADDDVPPWRKPADLRTDLATATARLAAAEALLGEEVRLTHCSEAPAGNDDVSACFCMGLTEGSNGGPSCWFCRVRAFLEGR